MAWLLRNPKAPTQCSAEAKLWWRVLNQAAKDLDKGHRSEAIDAYEFLEVTGKWLATTLFDVSPERYERELRARVARRSGEASIFLQPR